MRKWEPRLHLRNLEPEPTHAEAVMLRWMPLILGLLWLDVSSLWADDAIVEVQLVSGREFRGILDARTNEEQLWLRSHVGEVQLQRPIVWNRIATAELNGESTEIEDLKKRS